MSTHDEPLNHALDVIREHFQGTQNELANLLSACATHGQRTDEMLAAIDTLRQEVQETQGKLAPLLETSSAHGQQAEQLAAAMETFHQELQELRQASSGQEKALRTETAKYREQLETHTRELATLTKRSQTHTQELNGHIDSLTNLHKQEQSQREASLATLSKLNERVSDLEHHFSEEQARSADALRTDRERLAALEKCLSAQAEQFGKFDPVLRELHGQMVTLHERLTALESVESAQFLDNHEQRLGETERQAQEQAHTLEEIQQTLEQLASQTSASVRLNKILMGGLVAAGIAIVVLLIQLSRG